MSNFNDINKLVADIYNENLGDIFKKMRESIIWKIPAPVGPPIYGPTRYEYSQICLDEFIVAFQQFLLDWPDIVITGSEDGVYITTKQGYGERILNV